MLQKKDEPEKLSRLKKLLALFKPGSADRLLLRLRGMKQGAEYAGAQAKMNLMNLIGEGGFTPDAEGLTAEEFEQQAALLDSLGLEKAKTDSLLNVLKQEKNIETESSKITEDFLLGMLGSTKAKTLMNISSKLGLKEGASKGLAKILKQSDLDRLNTAFAKRDFFKILRGLENNLIDPTSSAYQRALRYKKVYDELY